MLGQYSWVMTRSHSTFMKLPTKSVDTDVNIKITLCASWSSVLFVTKSENHFNR